jgi:hypothetical protein
MLMKTIYIYKARPTWLGGSIRPDNISARDWATGQLFLNLGLS